MEGVDGKDDQCLGHGRVDTLARIQERNGDDNMIFVVYLSCCV